MKFKDFEIRPTCFLDGHKDPKRWDIVKWEKHEKPKLTEQDVLDIRAKRAEGKSFGKLAQEYGVHKRTIQDAVSGKNWGFLPQPPKGE